MQLVSKTPEKLIFTMPANESLANALRRSVSEIQTLAIEEVEIFKNDSALYDEVVAHRLGLVPLVTEKSMTSNSEINLKLQKNGPGTVYSGDLKGKVKIVYDEIPITLLDEGHKIELVATAKLGSGIEHAKHTPGLLSYRHLLKIKSNPEIDKLVNKSKSPYKPEKSGNNWLADLDESLQDIILKINKDAINDSDQLLVIVESYGNMPAQDILKEASKSLNKNLAEFEKAIK